MVCDSDSYRNFNFEVQRCGALSWTPLSFVTEDLEVSKGRSEHFSGKHNAVSGHYGQTLIIPLANIY